MTYRGQFVFRLLKEKEDGLYFGIMGIVESPFNVFRDEHIIPVIRQCGEGNPGFVIGYHLDEAFSFYPVEPCLRHCDLAQLLEEDIWRFPLEKDGGGILLRRTLMNARSGHEVLAAVGVWRLNFTYFDPTRMHEIVSSGFLCPETRTTRQGFIVTQGESFPVLFDPTDHLADIDILQQPIWGWGPERLAFISTLHLEVAQRRDLIVDLLSLSPARRIQKMGSDEIVEDLLDSLDARLLCEPQTADQFSEDASQTRSGNQKVERDPKLQFGRVVGEENFGTLVSNGRRFRHAAMRTRRDKRDASFLARAMLPDIMDKVSARMRRGSAVENVLSDMPHSENGVTRTAGITS